MSSIRGHADRALGLLLSSYSISVTYVIIVSGSISRSIISSNCSRSNNSSSGSNSSSNSSNCCIVVVVVVVIVVLVAVLNYQK